jgi:ATP-binding cassette subfamily B protein
MDCGPTCVRMVAKYYGRTISLDHLRKRSQYGREGTSILGLSEAAENIGLKSVGAKLTFDQLLNDVPLPAIIHWNQYHFVVLTPKSTKRKLIIADPASGLVKLSREDFLKNWISTSDSEAAKGVALLLEPTPSFDNVDVTDHSQLPKSRIDKAYFFKYLLHHKAYFVQIFLGVLVGSGLQLILPYLTQSIVDRGIDNRDLYFIKVILAGQLMLLFSQTVIEFIRNRILLYISTKINVSLLSNFWSKLLKLPVQFFDSKHPGDIMQRLTDHQRIESFLTGTALNTLFSLVTLVVFSIVLLSYNAIIFGIFIAGSILYVGCIRFFLSTRRKLDFQRFMLAAKETSASIQLVYGMQEIKLNNAEDTFRWAWESLQAGLFKLNFKSLSLNQYQQISAFFINQSKNILITFIVAKLVIQGELTIGMMLAIQYIIGQLNSPIEQLVGFSLQAQDAKMSLERLNDIHTLDDEEPAHQNFNHFLPEQHDIHLRNVSFVYPGAGNEPVLKGLNLTIPKGKVTAIVGMSGSGKTTLVKLLLKFYNDYTGDIFLGNINFNTISPKFWRSISGAVMQDSFIFNDTIRKNITVTNEETDEERLLHACKTANILSYIEDMPLGFNTKLGAEGSALSGGQKQRLAIARAIHKNPKFIFFDEATNSLDANNEKVILKNLQEFFNGRTVIVVAHRLSTVKSADKIVVIDRGEIAEEGSHSELVTLKGKYYELVKNQLELDQ